MPAENPQVFIKVIRGGGTNSVHGLVGQMKYITKKRDILEFDADGKLVRRGEENPRLLLRRFFEDDVEVTPEEFEQTAQNWVDESGVPEHTRDLTTHLVVSFPADSNREAATQAALDWADEVFRSGNYARDIYNYGYAVHRDKDHLHVHFIINRRGQNGHWLKISKSSEGLHYDIMRERMVPHALNHGIVLDATSREERGIIIRPITSPEYYRRAEGRVKVFELQQEAGPPVRWVPIPSDAGHSTPDTVYSTPATSAPASPPPQNPSSGAGSPSFQSAPSTRQGTTRTGGDQHATRTDQSARERDMSEERHLYGPSGAGSSVTSSSPSSTSSGSPPPASPPPQNPSSGAGSPSFQSAPSSRQNTPKSGEAQRAARTDQNARERDMSEERHLYGLSDAGSSGTSSPASRSSGSLPQGSPPAGTGAMESPGPVSPERKRTQEAADLHDKSLEPAKRRRTGEPETGEPDPADNPAASSTQALPSEETSAARKRKRAASRITPDDNQSSKRPRLQHPMTTRSQTEADKRKLRSGNKYQPIPRKPRGGNDDGHGM
jgi:type IV secretion system T-DNA border endonuclease VirD2